MSIVKEKARESLSGVDTNIIGVISGDRTVFLPKEMLAVPGSELLLGGEKYTAEADLKEKLLTKLDNQPGVDITDRLLQLSLELNKENIELPDHISLIIKNFYYLDRLAKKVGFANIVESYLGKTKYKAAKMLLS